MITALEMIQRVRIHPAGWPFIGIFLLSSFVLSLFFHALGLVGFVLTAWCTYFFRDPFRVPPVLSNAVVSPADGLVMGIVSAEAPRELGGYGEGTWTRLSIFLNIFDVHVNRIPLAGRVLMRVYNPGKFLNASLDKASELNERNSLVLETPQGLRLIVVQIAGLIARRILCEINLGDEVTLGQSYGIIRFGSRVDLYLPPQAKVSVVEGQRMVGGETVVAFLSPP